MATNLRHKSRNAETAGSSDRDQNWRPEKFPISKKESLDIYAHMGWGEFKILLVSARNLKYRKSSF